MRGILREDSQGSPPRMLYSYNPYWVLASHPKEIV